MKGLMKIKLNSVIVRDQNHALGFYTGVLGFIKKTEIPVGDYKWLTVVSPDEPDGDNVMMYMHVTGSRPDGRRYDNDQAYLYRFRNGKLIEGQTIPVDQHAFEEFLAE